MRWLPAGSVTLPVNIASGKGYRGINISTLWVAAQAPAIPPHLHHTGAFPPPAFRCSHLSTVAVDHAVRRGPTRAPAGKMPFLIHR